MVKSLLEYNKMKIVLEIYRENKIKLSLFEGGKEKDSLEWKDDNSLSRVLLVNLDRLLRTNGVGLDPAPISQVKNKGASLFKNMKLASHGAGRKDWAVRPTRRGRYPQQNWCGVDKISGYKIISDVPENWTSARIAKITFESIGIATLAR